MNSNTKYAKKHGFCSLTDMLNNNHKIFKGTRCNTAWDNPNSKRNKAKNYKKAVKIVLDTLEDIDGTI